MKDVFALALALTTLLAATVVQAQTTDLVFFTDDGAKFTLIIDGDVKNAEPAARVVATNIRNGSPMIMLRFADSNIPQLRKTAYFTLGMEYTTMITMNKKGERVLRRTGQAELGTAARSEPVKPKPVVFEDDIPVVVQPAIPVTIKPAGEVVGTDHVTTVVVVEEEAMDAAPNESININMGVNGVGVNMTVKVDEGTSTATGSTRTTRTTTTTTSSVATGAKPQPAPVAPPTVVKEPEVYRMPGYSGPVGCGMPMTGTEFADARKTIESKNFEETKLTVAKQVGRERCFTVEQVKSIMGVFSFEDSKIEFAKYAYDRTHDVGNYYKLNEAFTFDSSVDDLNEFLQSK